MIAGSLARRYARAIVSLGEDQKNLDKIGADLHAFAQALKVSQELVKILSNPAFPRADRKKIVDALASRFSVQPVTRTFLYVLLDKERLDQLPAISREIDALLEARAGRIGAEVTSATPLSAQQLAAITATLEKLSGKKVHVEKREDPALIGGVVAKLGDVVYDGSVRTQLRQLRDSLNK